MQRIKLKNGAVQFVCMLGMIQQFWIIASIFSALNASLNGQGFVMENLAQTGNFHLINLGLSPNAQCVKLLYNHSNIKFYLTTMKYRVGTPREAKCQ
jgi:hypothetical protein